MNFVAEKDAGALTSLVKLEFDSIDCCQMALSSYRGQAPASLLRTILDEHCQAAEILRVFEEEFVDRLARMAPLCRSRLKIRPMNSNPTDALSALEEREREMIERYMQATQDESFPQECAEVIAGHLLPQSRRHLTQVEWIKQSTDASRRG